MRRFIRPFDPARFGEGVAILVGDLSHAYADALMAEANPAARRIWDDLRIELSLGQYLDLRSAASGQMDWETARQVSTFKSALYTIVRPLQLGASLIGPADPALLASGHELFTKWQCIKCHVVAGKLPNQDPANMAPDLAKVPQRLRAQWLDDWLADPQKIQPGTRMPANFPRDPSENAFPEILGGDQAKQIDAVRKARVYFVDGNAYCNRPGPRLADTTEILAEMLHPEVAGCGHRNQAWAQPDQL